MYFLYAHQSVRFYEVTTFGQQKQYTYNVFKYV